ncbi:hypothetical protein [Hymenobacter psychrotolerans]|uniref:hypothetical protein n=1 Tax=Hymenobacter psychrotolerans TaxID=344998 RepID=UPI001114738C|nr:hypothetical protein [Hymenobacter psychrotolerans]
MSFLPYVFGGVRLLLGVAILVNAIGLFGKQFKADSFFGKNKGIAIALGAFLLLSGLYTLFFSTADTYRV